MNHKKIKQLLSVTSIKPSLAVVLGSGFTLMESDEVVHVGRADFESLGFTPRGVVNGHKYEVSIYKVAGRAVMVFHGRLHLYEGYSQREVCFPVEVTKVGGVEHILLTCAAGGITDRVREGDFVRVKDHVNLTGGNPVLGINDEASKRRFLDLSNLYKNELNDAVLDSFEKTGLPKKEGVLAVVPGPVYETEAEVNFLKTIGADMVSMSTVPEAIASHFFGLKTAAVACISNHHSNQHHSLRHSEVISSVSAVESNFNRFFLHLVKALSI